MHKAVRSLGVPILFTTYPELMYDSQGFAKRVQRFAPCLGGVDPDFLPKLNVDIWKENMLKIEGTPAEYGAANPPASFGIDPSTMRCSAGRSGPHAPRRHHPHAARVCTRRHT